MRITQGKLLENDQIGRRVCVGHAVDYVWGVMWTTVTGRAVMCCGTGANYGVDLMKDACEQQDKESIHHLVCL